VCVSCPQYIKVNTKMKKLINEANENRIKLFYNLSELTTITGLKIRTLKYRMLQVKERYADIPNLLRKEGRTWKIHYTLIIEFLPKYNNTNKTIYTENWVSTSSWNTKNNYTIDYHLKLIDEVKKQLPSCKIGYTIERDKRGVNHVHLISTAKPNELTIAVESVIHLYLDVTECRVQTNKINNKYSMVEYLRKASLHGAII
jgi:hypothetical protein